MVDTGSKHRRTISKCASQAFSATVINGLRMTGRSAVPRNAGTGAASNSVALRGTTETEHAQLSTSDFYISRSKKGRNEPSTLGPAGSLRNRWRSSPASCAMWACVAVHPSR